MDSPSHNSPWAPWLMFFLLVLARPGQVKIDMGIVFPAPWRSCQEFSLHLNVRIISEWLHAKSFRRLCISYGQAGWMGRPLRITTPPFHQS
jgi:hypothetical protein